MRTKAQFADMTERAQRVSELVAAGWSNRRIAKELRLCDRTVLRYRHRLGLPVKPPAPRLTDEELAWAKRLLDEGASYGEVSRTLGRQAAAIQKKLPGYTLPPSEAGRIAALTKSMNALERRLKAVTA